jgi:hypothetical protein
MPFKYRVPKHDCMMRIGRTEVCLLLRELTTAQDLNFI